MKMLGKVGWLVLAFALTARVSPAQEAIGPPSWPGDSVTAGDAVVATATVVSTQQGQQPRRPPPPPSTPAPASRPSEPALTIRGLVDFGYAHFSASQSLEAVYGDAGGIFWGGGVRVAHRIGWFAQVTASRFAADGQRVFVFDDEVFPLGVPSKLTIIPLDVTGGWRFVPRPRTARPAPPGRPGARPAPAPLPPQRRARFVPYVGGGIGRVQVTERADFAASSDDSEENHTSYHVLGGLEIPFHRWFGTGVEAGWRWVPDALAGNGVAQEFNESGLDHFFVTVRLTIGR